jgi:hypothetical protein
VLALDPCAPELAQPNQVVPRPSRLPGVTFAPAPPEPDRILPRMDVAVFVGFAERGPVDWPLVVEDLDAFTRSFGGEVVFVRDAARGSTVRGQLRGAVQAYFRNGGRRCWIVRVENPAPSSGAPDEVPPIDAAMFLDPELAETSIDDLLPEADAIRYQRTPCRRLRGIHAALEIEEATIIAVPDAALPRWGRRIVSPVPAESASPKPSAPDDRFESCEADSPVPPRPVIRRSADAGAFDVAWAEVEGALSYEIQRRREPGAASDAPAAVVTETKFRVQHAEGGTYGYRVRSIGPGGTGEWSEWVRVVVDPTPTYAIPPEADRSAAVEVHAALLRLCAARGDLFAILSLPEAVDAAGAIQHVADVRSAVTEVPGDLTLASARDADQRNVLSFGALYHPWVMAVQASDAVPAAASAEGDAAAAVDPPPNIASAPAVACPPDGCVAGVFANRAEIRGAWIAPANVAFRDVVGLTRPFRDDELAGLYAGQVNVVRRTPSAYRTLATHTLALDPTFRPINVRRLLSLLRRLALLRGVDYVFEPNDNAFRRRIQRGFEALLATLFERGAFAGSRATDGYRVVVGDPPNSRQSLDAGRLIVELKVAPSMPLEFLTVRLVRSGERLSVEAA